jgi:Protein of unknown function (DUF642)
MKTSIAALALALMSGMLLCGTAQASLITNGSFDNTSGQFTNNSGAGGDLVDVGSNAITGWTISGSYALLWVPTPMPPASPYYGGLTSSPGNASGYFLDLTGNTDQGPYDGVSQLIATTAGATYKLTFDLGSATQWGFEDGLTASAGSTSQVFTSMNTNTTDTWTSEVLDFTATGPSTLISLVGASGQHYIGLDNVDVVQTSMSATPLPATWLMMFSGLLGLGFFAYRGSNKNNGAATLTAA